MRLLDVRMAEHQLIVRMSTCSARRRHALFVTEVVHYLKIPPSVIALGFRSRSNSSGVSLFISAATSLTFRPSAYARWAILAPVS